MKRVLVACEESQRVCIAFRERGFEAYSCDILPCSGGHPEWHIQVDVYKLLYVKTYPNYMFMTQDGEWHDYEWCWDLIIAHPPCTYLAVCGNKYFNEEVYGAKAKARKELREKAIDFFMLLVHAPCKHIAIENPVGCMSSRYRKPDQIIQPWMFGESYSKKTCLWLKNLPELKPTKIVDPGEFITFDSGKRMPKWYSELWGNAKERSKTFRGIAEAMADQWGKVIEDAD